jgi:hypothetical protein
VHSLRLDHNPRLVTCGTRTTLYSAAVASPARVRLACECGLAMNYWLHVMAGLLASAQTLAALLELGMPLTGSVVEAAAQSRRMNILQHLLSDEQCPRPDNISRCAASSGDISMLKWLRAQSWCVFDAGTCTGAAQYGHLAALQHLRNDGCEWDVELIACDAAASGSIELVEWLRQQYYVVIHAHTMTMAARFG